MSKVVETNDPRNKQHDIIAESKKTVKSSKGRARISEEDIEVAFKFFDVKGSGKITCTNLRERFEALTKKITKKELKSILDGKDSITMQEMKDVLKESGDLSIDPYVEAFSILDPTGKGFISEDRLKKIFANLGYGNLSDEELQLLITTGDADKDGQIGLSDFGLLGTSL
jgi:Ca2+-binding EF-hand superfamily protein